MFNYNYIKNKSLFTLNSLVNSNFGKTITYKKFISETFDPTTGSNVKTYEDYEIKTVEETVALEISGASSVLKAIGYSAGEKLYYIPANEFPRDAINDDTLKDIIIDNSVEYQVKKCIPIFNILVIIQV